jgi:hypothetical protein
MKKNINIMGSEVEDGFKCKPKILDPNKPIMHYKNIIFVCVDKRCATKGSHKKADELRELLKEIKLDTGYDRIKVSKSFCFGACRYKQVASIFSNTKQNGKSIHNNIWLKNIDTYDTNKWLELFSSIKNDLCLEKFEQINTNPH